MANIDNTVIFEILARVWNLGRDKMGLYAHQGMVAGKIGLYSKECTFFARGQKIEGARGTWWPSRWRKDEGEGDSETEINSQPMPRQGKRDREKYWTFESQVYTALTDGQKDLGKSDEEVKEIVLSVCRFFCVDDNLCKLIKQMESLQEIKKFIIRRASEVPNRKVTAEWLAGKHCDQLAQGYEERISSVGTESKPVNAAACLDSDQEEGDDRFRALDGCQLVSGFSIFAPWKPAANEQMLREDCYGTLEYPEGDERDIPYLEVFGSEQDGQWEFVQGENFDCHCTEGSFDMETYLGDGAKEGLEAEIILASSLSWKERGPVMWLDSLRIQMGDNSGSLSLGLGKGSYRGHRVYRAQMPDHLSERQDFLRTVKGIRGEPERLGGKPWANCGGGCWITAKDEGGKEYLVVSYRNPKRVAEVPGILGYSSSGSYEYRDGTFAAAMCREIGEELGIPVPKAEKLRMISFGIDTERYLIQASFVWRTDYTLRQINRFRRNRASTGGEQHIFYVPFESNVCYELLRQAAFEPGAAYSLMRILQKYT